MSKFIGVSKAVQHMMKKDNVTLHAAVLALQNSCSEKCRYDLVIALGQYEEYQLKNITIH